MNKIENQILLYIYKNSIITQRELAKHMNCSLGMINKSLNHLKELGYLDANYNLTDFAKKTINNNKPSSAIILAAGLGMRMAPINNDISKGLLVVNQQTLIENIIHKLHDRNIYNIFIIVGYMKEQYEYLIDKYNVRLIINNKYRETNNCYSLYLAREHLNNSYIIPCDLYLDDNPFQLCEYSSWYLFHSSKEIYTNYKITKSNDIEILKKMELRKAPLGIAYLNQNDSLSLKKAFDCINHDKFYYKHYYWENILFENHIHLHALFCDYCDEINTFEDLRNLDINSSSLKSEIIDIITQSLNIDISKIKNIHLSKKGMTNRSFLFETDSGKYMMRIPGEGTDQLINRNEEGLVYQTISHYHIADEVLYFNPANGYKLTKFITDSRTCNSLNEDDLIKCMRFLKKFHNLNLTVEHDFNIFEKINFYENLRNKHSLYQDYQQTKSHVFQLRSIIEKLPKHLTLTHIDAVPDNFLIYKENNVEKIRLIDWEYAGMQDSDVDIAMFCIYSLYNKEQCDHLIDIYYENKCPDKIRLKIYCYIACCGFLWSNWCEYKYSLGVEFGEYSLAQYRYAKDFYKFAMKFMEEENLCIQ